MLQETRIRCKCGERIALSRMNVTGNCTQCGAPIGRCKCGKIRDLEAENKRLKEREAKAREIMKQDIENDACEYNIGSDCFGGKDGNCSKCSENYESKKQWLEENRGV